MRTLSLRYGPGLLALMLAGISAFAAPAFAAGNPAFLKLQAKGDFDAVLSSVKTALEAKQFMITGEEDLAKGLENNKEVFGEDKWNTIGFQRATAVHFCSLTFNQEVFNQDMNWSVLCPFKAVLYNMKASPNDIHVVMVKPSYLLARDPHKKAGAIGRKIEARILDALKEGIGR